MPACSARSWRVSGPTAAHAQGEGENEVQTIRVSSGGKDPGSRSCRAGGRDMPEPEAAASPEDENQK